MSRVIAYHLVAAASLVSVVMMIGCDDKRNNSPESKSSANSGHTGKLEVWEKGGVDWTGRYLPRVFDEPLDKDRVLAIPRTNLAKAIEALKTVEYVKVDKSRLGDWVGTSVDMGEMVAFLVRSVAIGDGDDYGIIVSYDASMQLLEVRVEVDDKPDDESIIRKCPIIVLLPRGSDVKRVPVFIEYLGK